MKLNQKKYFRFTFDEHILLTTYILVKKPMITHLVYISNQQDRYLAEANKVPYLLLYVLVVLHRCNTGNLAASSVRATKFTVFSRNSAQSILLSHAENALLRSSAAVSLQTGIFFLGGDMHRGSRGTIYRRGTTRVQGGECVSYCSYTECTCNSHLMIVSVNWIFVIYS